ncbi:MAG: tetratricopeptide repeat protein [Brevinema sp.]
MDMLTLSLLFLVVLVTVAIGYGCFLFLFPQRNKELHIARLFDQGEYAQIVSMTPSLQLYSSSLSIMLYGARSRVYCDLLEEAVEWFEKALLRVSTQNIDDRVFIEVEIGDIYTKLKKLDQANIHYRTAMSLKGDHEIANYKFASLQFSRKNFESCRNILRELLKKNPKLADARRLYAECLVELHLYAKAIRQYGLLARAGEKIVSYNYARCLKVLKIFERAAEIYQNLLTNNLYPESRENMICDLAEIYVSLRLFPVGLGFIEQHLPNMTTNATRMRLSYTRANLLFQRGDKVIAIYEYKNLYNQNPNYRDLATIVSLYGDLLTYPFLNHYFTSNEAAFEMLVTSVVGDSAHVIKRNMDFYVVHFGNNAHVFYRDIYRVPEKMLGEFDAAIRGLEDVDFLHLWCVNGMEGHYSLTGSTYKFVLRTGQDFLLNINDASKKLGFGDGPVQLGFVSGMPDAPELIPLSQDENVDQLLKENNLESFIPDDILNRALDN